MTNQLVEALVDIAVALEDLNIRPHSFRVNVNHGSAEVDDGSQVRRHGTGQHRLTIIMDYDEIQGMDAFSVVLAKIDPRILAVKQRGFE